MNSENAYSALKSAWHIEDIEAMRRGEQVAPHQVHFIISDLCNHDCHFCAYRMSTGFSSEQFGADTGKGFTMNPNRMIPTPKAIELLDDFCSVGVGAVQFTGGGEPTVHPDHLELFDHAQQRGMDTSLVTNGALLRPGWEKTYGRMAWIRVSVDAGSAEVYSRVRKVPESQYNKTLRNLTAIVENAPDTCLVGAGYCVTRENYMDIEAGCLALRATGVPYVRLCAMFSTEGASYYNGIYGDIKRRIAHAKHLEDDTFKVVDLFGDRISDLNQHAPDYEFCGYQQMCTYIGADLKVYRCCTTSYTKHGEIGDLSSRSYKDWFFSLDKEDAIDCFDARTCKVCQFNNKNRVINYMLDEKPTHVEFV